MAACLRASCFSLTFWWWLLSCLSTQVSFLKQHLDGVSLFVDSCKGSFVTNDGEVPDIPSDYSK